ncbi:MAG: radical SAM protein [Clostridiales bacterium]|nr:radical SAM protein [Clostridiales bacterium]
MICSICPRKCNVERENANGFCRTSEKFEIARAALHFWEEPCISGKNGSGAVFFSGCNLKCVYCQNYEISRDNKGVEVSRERLIGIFENLVSQGAENINLVNPTHYATMIADVLKVWKSPVPIVYNSSGYESVETLKILDGLVDIYLPDFKYIRNDKALRYSSASDYPETVKKALAEMYRQTGNAMFDDGMMKKGMIIRHLILPQNTNSSLEIIDYVSDNFENAYLSLMAQYVPCTNLEDYKEINRTITKREYDKVVDYALSKGLEKIFIQELSSADDKYIPPFDFSGVI